MADGDREWEVHLRSLSSAARDATDPASDPSLLNSVRRLHEICKVSETSVEELVARAYPHLNKIFQRCVASISQSQTSNGLLLLSLLQFFLDFGDSILHDAEPSLRTFFRTCLSREFADPVVAEAILRFLSSNKAKLAKSSPTLLPQFFPLLLKLIAWNGEKLEKPFLHVFPGLISPGSFISLFPSIVDLPLLVVALEKVEKSSGPLVGTSIALIQKSAAPEMLLALMDEAYTGSTIGDGGTDSESEDNTLVGVPDSLFLDLLKDENDGLAERHWTSPSMTASLQALVNTTPLSTRLKEALCISPRILDSYFALSTHAAAANDSLVCALIPLIMTRYSTLFPDKTFSYCVQKRLLEFVLSTFRRSPHFIALLKKPITDRLGEAYDGPAKAELAMQLCWAIGEYGGGGASHREVARELFEGLELILYENLSLSHIGLDEVGGPKYRRSFRSRIMCFVVTAIAKLATCHHELLPRARVSLAKVAHSRISDARVCGRARDYLGLMSEPAICLSVLGPCVPPGKTTRCPGTVDWDDGGRKMVANVPFHLLSGHEGAPYHDFSFADILPRE